MEHSPEKPRPSVNELLTDLYEITMAYSYFKQGRHNLPSVFDAFFRKAPFKGKVRSLSSSFIDFLSKVHRFCWSPRSYRFHQNL